MESVAAELLAGGIKVEPGEERLVDIVASIQANHSRAGRSKKSASFIPLSPINHTLAVG
jgi:hypothetical protein